MTKKKTRLLSIKFLTEHNTTHDEYINEELHTKT